MSFNFKPLGRAVESAQLQEALNLSRAHLHKLVTKTYNIGMGAALPRPAGVLCGTFVWDVEVLERELPAFLAAREIAAKSRSLERVDREPVDLTHFERFQGLPHVLGWIDAAMISDHFGLGKGGGRKVWEWASRGVLLPAPGPEQIIGRHVWKVEDIKPYEEKILQHLQRRQELSESRS